MAGKRVILFMMASMMTVATLAIGCGPTLGTRARLVARVLEFRSRCRGRYRVLQLSENAFEVNGCGASTEFTDVIPGERREMHLMRPAVSLAREDMRCNYQSLEPSGPRHPTQRTFVGCGATASYTLLCAEDAGCAWQRQGEVVAIAPAPPSSYSAVAPTLDAPPADAPPADAPEVPAPVAPSPGAP